jgi:2-polyprenyl-3-methyl-5-hydroxy-6-metoxy-1,4-benzoquinol methylase
MNAAAVEEKSYRAEVCNFCGSDQYTRIHHFPEYQGDRDRVTDVSVVRCSGCGVRRRFPAIVDDYEETYHELYVEQGEAIHPHQLSHFADLMTVRLRDFYAKNLKFLDVGCSTGRVLRLASTMGFEVTGLDYSQWACDHCAKLGFSVRHGSLIGQWKESAVFDIIHCCHTIEHVPDPVGYVREMRRLLKPGGQLMLACPNYASLPRLVKREKWLWCLDSHLWQFTARQVRAMLENNGFEVASLRTHHGLSPQTRWKKWLLDKSAALGFGDGLNVVAVPR